MSDHVFAPDGELAAGVFDVIVVDPPWSYGQPTQDIMRNRGNAARHYTTIGKGGAGEINRRTGEGVQEIIDSAPVSAWAAKNSHCYLWTTNPKLPFAFAVLTAWGFEYKTTLTWVKTTAANEVLRGGMGWFFRGATEHVLFGVRGNKPIPASVRQPNVLLANRGRHSEKPNDFYALLDTIYPTERKLDVFARRMREGWHVYGDEIK